MIMENIKERVRKRMEVRVFQVVRLCEPMSTGCSPSNMFDWIDNVLTNFFL
jgi:hypothetical protein